MIWKPADNLLPLSASEFEPQELPVDLMSADLNELFPNARDAKAALSGLLLLAGHWESSHQVAQDVETREGSYWHAIAHRIEPDSWNSAYWFGRVGKHPIFAAIHDEAARVLSEANVGWRLRTQWDAKLFIDWCEEARNDTGSEKELVARMIQRAECDLLFAWCAARG